MRKIELEELKKIELDILKNVAKFCDENNIRYYLAGGTLLGAIRHKGFIPWDDDIDIIIPRPDYERFETLYTKNINQKYKLISLNTNNEYIYTFAKVYNTDTILFENIIRHSGQFGVYIDIFPMDGLPSDIEESDKHFQRQMFWWKIYGRCVMKLFQKRKNLLKTIVGPFFDILHIICINLIGKQKLLKYIESDSKKYDFATSEFVGVIGGSYGKRERMHCNIFKEDVTIEFENEMFKAPKGYHEYLTNLYGDYMTPPPLEKQKSHHIFDAYWKD